MIRRPPRSTLFPTRRSSDLLIALASDRAINSQIPEERQQGAPLTARVHRSEEHTSELQSRFDLVCRLLLEKKKKKKHASHILCHRFQRVCVLLVTHLIPDDP